MSKNEYSPTLSCLDLSVDFENSRFKYSAEILSTKISPELLYGFDIDLRVNRGYNESPGSLDKQKKVKKLTNWRTYCESQLLLSQKQAVSGIAFKCRLPLALNWMGSQRQ